MSWGGGDFGSMGSSGASGASTAGGAADTASGAGSLADAGSGTGMAGDAAGSFGGAIGSTNIYGQMADVGGSAPASSGFGVDAVSNLNAGTGPTMNNANMQTYGTTDPSFMDKAMNGLEQFQKGSEQSLSQAYQGWGNNPQTYGYVAGKVAGLMQGGGGNQRRPADVTTNINYQQPENDYLRRRRGY